MDASGCATLLQRGLAMLIFIFLVIGFSITNTIVFMHVCAWLRKLVCGVDDATFRSQPKQGFRVGWLGRLFHCHTCMGFWVGVLLSYFHGGFIVEYVDSLGRVESAIGDGFLLSAFNFALWLVLRRLGAEEL